jgi:putative RNA 2'-phosphotransferase
MQRNQKDPSESEASTAGAKRQGAQRSGAKNHSTSKLLALVLRHQPQAAHITLDDQGWADVDALLSGLARRGRRTTRADLERIVGACDKQRYELDGDRIRARQGHSVPIQLDYPQCTPPDVLWHGTHPSALDAILRDGLRPMNRHDVHLSANQVTASQVGQRRGRPVLLQIDAARLHADGGVFRVTGNHVWLIDQVPPGYLSVSGSGSRSGATT